MFDRICHDLIVKVLDYKSGKKVQPNLQFDVVVLNFVVKLGDNSKVLEICNTKFCPKSKTTLYQGMYELCWRWESIKLTIWAQY